MGIVKKDKIYFFRGYVPKKLLTLLGQQTFDKSLKTKNKNKAIILAKPLTIKFKYLMKELEQMIEETDEIYLYIDNFFNKTFDDIEKSLYNKPFSELESMFNHGYFAERIEFFQYIIDKEDFSEINDYIKGALDGYSKTFSDTDMYTLKKYIATKLMNHAITLRSNVQKEYYDVQPLPNTKTQIITSSTPILEKPKTTNLQYYIYEYLENEKKEASNSFSSISLRETALRSLLLEFGDIDVKDITRKELTTYRDRLKNLPNKALAKTNKNYKKAKNLIDIITINNNYNYTQKTISEGTVGKYIRIVKNFFKFLHDYDYIDKNIADGLKSKQYTSITTTDDRLPFTNEDLEIIFSSPFYTKKLEDNLNKKIEKVFAPIIAIYSTMRLNEIASLYVGDIRRENGIYYFDINNEKDKTIKNKTSIRKIPIHKKIIEAGFLEYIDSLPKDSSLRLWGNLTKKITDSQTEKGTYSSNISNWFRVFKKPLGFSKQKVFHSTRHTAINNLKQQKIDTIAIAEIAGHSNNSITIDRYSSTFDMKTKQEVVNKITYNVAALDKLLPRMKAMLKKP